MDNRVFQQKPRPAKSVRDRGSAKEFLTLRLLSARAHILPSTVVISKDFHYIITGSIRGDSSKVFHLLTR